MDEQKIPTVEPELFPEDTELDSAVVDDFGTGGVTTNANGGYVHDLLVVYTRTLRESTGQATLESQIQNAVAAANQAYQNSNVDITLNLVGMAEVSYTETSNMQTMVYDLRGTSDGKMDHVHALRDDLGADVVSLITKGGSGCGIAFSMRNESASFASSAFNVVKKSCLSNHSLAHEVGHNQGNMHNRESTSNTGAYPYSYGYRRCASDGTGFRTVMSYSCSGANRVTQFSNPNVNFNGYPTGVSYESNPSGSAENVRSMNNTADTVTDFRAGSGGGGEPTVPNAPSSLSASADSLNRVTVAWSDNSDDETGFKLARSSNGVDYSQIATLGAGTTSFSESGLATGATYYYKVRAYNSAGNSDYSNVDSVTIEDDSTGTVPDQPSNVAVANNGNGTATLTWRDNSSNETAFDIKRQEWDEARSSWLRGVIVGSVPSGVTSLVDESGAGRFRYKVQASNGSGGSGFASSNATDITDDSDTEPPPPEMPSDVTVADNRDGTATVTWRDNSSNETSFDIKRQQWDEAGSRWLGEVVVGSVAANVTSRFDASGTGRFRYKVQAANNSGGSGYAVSAATDITDDSETEPPPVEDNIVLSSNGYKVKGRQKADLRWSGATSASVDIYRDGSKLTTRTNSGAYTDNINKKGNGRYVYRVCNAGTSTCSSDSTVQF